jgi:plastocyanin
MLEAPRRDPGRHRATLTLRATDLDNQHPHVKERDMLSLCRRSAISIGVAALFSAASLAAQSKPHMIVVKMVDSPNAQFAFQPSEIAAQRGDTIRFVQASTAPHDVAFRKRPKAAKLGAASTSPYLIAPGQTYDLVIDIRFPDGVYDFVCDPHEGAGMHGTLTVGAPGK